MTIFRRFTGNEITCVAIIVAFFVVLDISAMNYIGSPLPAHSSEGSVAHARGRAQSRDGRRDDVHDKLEYGLPGFFFHGKGCFKVQGSKVQSSRFKVQGSRFRFQVIVFVIVIVLFYP